MPTSQTLTIDFSRLRDRGPSSNVVVRMMLAFNDISLANQSLATYSQPLPRARKHTEMGARLYFLRLQLGHLNEALKLIKEVSEDATLRNFVEKCSATAREQFDLLEACQQGGSKYPEFKKAIELVRHKVTFHYDPGMVEVAIADRASRETARFSSATRGDDFPVWRFKAADHIVDSIVCRQIWKIPRTSDLRREADQMAAFAYDVCVAYLGFAGEYIFQYCRN